MYLHVHVYQCAFEEMGVVVDFYTVILSSLLHTAMHMYSIQSLNLVHSWAISEREKVIYFLSTMYSTCTCTLSTWTYTCT